MSKIFVYNEAISSNKTHTLFITLTISFFALSMWCWSATGLTAWSVALTIFFAFFLFYSFNYRTLKIQLTPDILQLTFGIIAWKIATANIKNCHVDETPMARIGGAGIHFTWIKGEYRSFWNFLEHPRVVISLIEKHGAVHEIAFSTRRPKEIIELIQNSNK